MKREIFIINRRWLKTIRIIKILKYGFAQHQIGHQEPETAKAL